MKKIFLILLALFVFSACQSLDEKLTEKAEVQEVPNSAYGVTNEPVKEKYKVPVKKVVVAIKNDTTMDPGFGQSPTRRVEAAGMVLMKNSEDKVFFSLDHLDEKLDPGKY